MKHRFQPRESALRNARATDQHGSGTATATEPLDALVSAADLQRVEVCAAGLPLKVAEAGRSAVFQAKAAYRMLSDWAWLARLDGRLLPRPQGPDDPVLLAQAYISQNGTELAEAVAGSIDAAAWAGAWLSRARKLKDSYGADDSGEAGAPAFDPTVREGTARSLLRDLDELELAGYACQLFGRPEPEIAKAVAACGRWLAGHADAFLSCGQRVRADLAMMRRDLPTADPTLARTVEKFLLVRDAVEEMEAELDFARIENE